MDTNLIPAINKSLQIDLPENISFEILKEQLSKHINQLIQSDFQKLVSILYGVDVSEQKLKSLLKEYPGSDAGKIIAELIIERQLQKIKSRKETKSNNQMPDDERW
jgi:hypothetical protein